MADGDAGYAWLKDFGAPPELLAQMAAAAAPAGQPGAAARAGASPPPSAPAAEPIHSRDTPFGKIAYYASKESQVKPLLETALQLYAGAASLETQLDEADEAMDEAAGKIDSPETIAKDVAKNTDSETNMRARNSRTQTDVAKQAAEFLRSVQTSLRDARTNLAIGRDDMKGIEDEKKADALLEEAQNIQDAVDTISKSADMMAIDPMKPTAIVGMVATLLTGQKIADLRQKAGALQDAAAAIKVTDVQKKIDLALADFQDLTTSMADAGKQAKETEKNETDDWKDVQEHFDGNAASKFRFADLDDAAKKANLTQAMAKRAVIGALATQNAVFQLTKLADGWLANAPEGARVIDRLLKDADGFLEGAVYTRDKIPAVLKQLEEAGAAAKEAVASVHTAARPT